MLYLLDANIFIQAKNFHYPFDVFPGFWEWMKRDMDAGIIGSVVPVFQELINGNDELVTWTKDCEACGCFLNVDDVNTQTKFADIANWATDPVHNFKQTALQEFLSVADSWLIAKALSTQAKIVTLEKYDVNCKKRILIPNVCNAFGITYINTVDLIRDLGIKFGLQ